MQNRNQFIYTKKWNTLLIVFCMIIFFVIVLEIIPRSYDLIAMQISYFRNDSINDSTFTDQNIAFNQLENESIRQQIKELSSSNSSKDISDIIYILDSLAFKNSIDISSFEPKNLLSKEYLKIQSISVKMIADYKDFYDYLYDIETSNLIMSYKNLLIDNTISSDSLNISMDLDIYTNL